MKFTTPLLLPLLLLGILQQGASALEVVSFNLIDAETHNVLVSDIQDGAVFNKVDYNFNKWDIQAVTDTVNETEIQSVVLKLNEGQANAVTKKDNIGPAYGLYSWSTDDYKGAHFDPGSYTLTATPYTGRWGSGDAGDAKTINFAIENTLHVTKFVLQDSNGTEIMELTEGQVLDKAAIGEKDVNIVAVTDPPTVGSVLMQLTGDATSERTDVSKPYSMWYSATELDIGSFTITATPYSRKWEKGDEGPNAILNFEVVNNMEVTRLVLVDGHTNVELLDLTDNMVIDMALYNTTSYNVKAVTEPSQVGSVIFEYDKPEGHNDTMLERNDTPYMYSSGETGMIVQMGVHTFTATPAFGRWGSSDTGISKQVTVKFENNLEVVRFELVNADTDQIIGELKDGDVIYLGDQTTDKFNILAIVPQVTVESVQFTFDDDAKTPKHGNEFHPTYFSLFGLDGEDIKGRELAVGDHSMEATPYTSSNAEGDDGTTLAINFSVNEGSRPCNQGKKEFLINVGGSGHVRSATRNPQTHRIALKDVDIDFSGLVGPFEPYASTEYFNMARVGNDGTGIKYTFEHDDLMHSCYEYDVMIGFVEFDDAFCTPSAEDGTLKKRIFDVEVNAGGPTSAIEALNVFEEAGACNKAYMTIVEIAPKDSVIEVLANTKEEYNSDGAAMLSFIKIKPSTRRRLDADCNKNKVDQEE